MTPSAVRESAESQRKCPGLLNYSFRSLPKATEGAECGVDTPPRLAISQTGHARLGSSLKFFVTCTARNL